MVSKCYFFLGKGSFFQRRFYVGFFIKWQKCQLHTLTQYLCLKWEICTQLRKQRQKVVSKSCADLIFSTAFSTFSSFLLLTTTALHPSCARRRAMPKPMLNNGDKRVFEWQRNGSCRSFSQPIDAVPVGRASDDGDLHNNWHKIYLVNLLPFKKGQQKNGYLSLKLVAHRAKLMVVSRCLKTI